MQLLQPLRQMTLGLLLVSTFPAAAQSNTLDEVPVATQNEISQVCLPVQFREGARAYRNCVQAELDIRANGGATDLGKLSFDDKYAVQQACAKAGGQSSGEYQSCVSTQINELSQVATPALDELREDELYVVQQSCFTAQSKQGAASYRQCLNDEIKSLLNIPAADISKLDTLKKNALQLRCSSDSSSAVQYRQCVADQFESIAGTEPEFLSVSTAAKVPNSTTPAVNTSAVSETVREVAEQAVSAAPATAQKVEPPALPETASVDGDTLTAVPVTILPRNVTPQYNSAALIEPTVVEPQVQQAEQLAATQPAPTNEPVSSSSNLLSMNTAVEPSNGTITTNSNTQSSLATAEARVISRPKLVETLELQAQARTQGVELESSTAVDTSTAATATPSNAQPMQKLGELWEELRNSLSSMDAIGWLLIAGVLALPALLLALFSVVRGFRSKTAAPPEYEEALDHRAVPELNSRRMRHEQEAANLFDDELADDHDAVTRIATKSERQAAQQRLQTQANETFGQAGSANQAAGFHASADNAHPGHATQRSNEWQSAFGHWLLQQPESSRLEACIEFLIYWVAYGDDRYPADLKKRLFTTTDLSSHDQIKRWVLKQDVFAFADVVGWLHNNATQKQLDQCVALIMALLVTEHCVTPIQNTLLRFLSDAFNIGKNQLEQRFDKAFGHPLPPIPRTDKHAWWVKQQTELMQRWEARFMATRPEIEQMIARLGLTENYDEAQVIHAYRRAARRCHPDRFSELGGRERALAAQQFTKFEEARDKLLGVSV